MTTWEWLFALLMVVGAIIYAALLLATLVMTRKRKQR